MISYFNLERGQKCGRFPAFPPTERSAHPSNLVPNGSGEPNFLRILEHAKSVQYGISRKTNRLFGSRFGSLSVNRKAPGLQILEVEFASSIPAVPPPSPAIATLYNLRRTGAKNRAFRALELVSRLSVSAGRGRNRQESPALFRKIPVSPTLLAETGAITTAARSWHSVSANAHSPTRSGTLLVGATDRHPIAETVVEAPSRQPTGLVSKGE